MTVKCPICNSESEVGGYSKYYPQGNFYKRTRKCTKCGYKFKSIEVVEEDYLEATELARSFVNLIRKHLYKEKSE